MRTYVPQLQPRIFAGLATSGQDRISAAVHDLVATIRRKRVAFTAASSRDEYEWVLRQAVNAEQDDAYMILVPPALPDQIAKGIDSVRADARLLPNGTVREEAMASNVAWALEREGPKGRIIFFAHDAHQQRHAGDVEASRPAAPLVLGLERTGMFLRAEFANDIVTIGTYYGRFDGRAGGGVGRAPAAGDLDALLGALGLAAYVADLRNLPKTGPLRPWFDAPHATRDGMGISLVNPVRAFDAIVYIDRITPARMFR
jgi:erythromycin esterase